MMKNLISRRQCFSAVGGGLVFLSCHGRYPKVNSRAPTAPVAIGKCSAYNSNEVTAVMARMFDQLGGLGGLVSGKTVAIKINMTGSPDTKFKRKPLEETFWSHPSVIGATVYLLGRAGAKRIRLLESPYNTKEPLEEFMLKAGWRLSDFLGAAPVVEFENTNFLGLNKKYSRLSVPNGGLLYPAFDLNPSYDFCDVFISIAKLKEHATTGLTLSMKNCFGITPCTIYGDEAGVDEPSDFPFGGRGYVIHVGERQPSKSSPAEKNPSSSRDAGYRVPRCVVDLCLARPVHLSIIDGIQTVTVGEGPWINSPIRVMEPISPGIIIASRNPVTVDAVGATVMGFDSMADRGDAPFENCDSTLWLAEDVGIGTRNPDNIEIVGTPLLKAKFPFKK